MIKYIYDQDPFLFDRNNTYDFITSHDPTTQVPINMYDPKDLSKDLIIHVHKDRRFQCDDKCYTVFPENFLKKEKNKNKKEKNISVPEPLPKNKGIYVTKSLIEWIKNNNFDQKISKDTIQLLQERDNFGFEKYGQHLRSDDGRNTIEDARQEIGDLLQYVYKAKLNNENLDKIRSTFYVLLELLE